MSHAKSRLEIRETIFLDRTMEQCKSLAFRIRQKLWMSYAGYRFKKISEFQGRWKIIAAFQSQKIAQKLERHFNEK